MAPHAWSSDPEAVARQLNAVNADAQSRLIFAVECVNGLHYLVDLDNHFISGDTATAVLGHGWQVIDMAHVRWAASSAITALDLCASALGRLYCGITGAGWELSVESASGKHWETLSKASPDASRWIMSVRGDHRYHGLLQLRRELTHRVLPRTYSVHVADALHVSDRTGPCTLEAARAHEEAQAKAQARAGAASITHRTRFPMGGSHVPVPEVICAARDLATEHVETFLALDVS